MVVVLVLVLVLVGGGKWNDRKYDRGKESEDDKRLLIKE
jgi:hypothetical protein